MRRVDVWFAVSLAAAMAACSEPTRPVSPDAAVAVRGSASSAALHDRYIVVFQDRVTDAPGLARQLAASSGGELGYVYTSALKGFSVRLNPRAAEALAHNPNVAFVEQDQVVSTATDQLNAPWGLDRIDQRSGRDGKYSYTGSGAGVHAYIIDTGIRTDHQDFGGRATNLFDAFGGSGQDCNGHGTHVAGTTGGSTYGVAKGVMLIGIRVLSCSGSGTTSGVIAGVDWVTANHVKPAVANMSLGGGASDALDLAVNRSIQAGVSYVVAAGNSSANACNYSPARVTNAMTIGATTSTDARASYSNYGSCIDWFAPGSSITSAWHTSSTATNTISGTSMASPHTAGVAVLYLQGNPTATPQQVRDALYAASTKGVVTSSSSANNHLLYSAPGGYGATEPVPEPEPQPNTAPTAGFTYACTDLTCSFTDTSTDAEGPIASRSWTFGDGASSNATNPTRTYATAGTYTVTLNVTDAGGLTASTAQSVTVTAPAEPSPPPAGLVLAAHGYKVKGIQHADLSWSGAAASRVDVRRDGAVIATVTGGSWTDPIGNRGGGSYTYQVCDAGTSTCSNAVTVTF